MLDGNAGMEEADFAQSVEILSLQALALLPFGTLLGKFSCKGPGRSKECLSVLHECLSVRKHLQHGTAFASDKSFF
jgi:hypothetical protein